MVEGESGPPHDAADPLVGQVLNGRFSIIEVIGTGGMGRVYKAIQAPLDRVVALKVLNPHYGGGGRDPNFQKRFFLEASLTSKLRHPNTITVIDYGRTDDGIFYIAMEYVEGHTLSQVLSTTGALPWPRAMHVAQQICRSLREAHKLGIVHRDLKPANVMLLTEETDQDVVKVLDFGLVKSMAADAEPEITQAGMMLGSPLYMAPEQARQVSDARSDIYSLGVVLFQMLMGRPPFQARESVDAIMKHLHQRPPTFHQTRPDLQVPPELEAVVMKALEKDPDRRFQTMDEVLEALRNVAATVQGASGIFASGARSGALVTPTPAPSPATTRPEPAPSEVSVEIVGEELPSRRRWILPGVFAASLLVGAAVVFALSRGGPPPPADAATVAPPVQVSAPAPSGPTTDEPAPPAPPPPVRFVVRSEPEGAQVFLGDRSLGRSPVTFEVARGEDGIAEATVTLTLDGYVSETVTARGEGPEVTVIERLRKRAPPPRRQPKKDDAYKDDPYQ